MNNLRGKVGCWAILALVVGSFTGCGGGGHPVVQPTTTSLELSPGTVAIGLGRTVQFTVSPANSSVSWSVSVAGGGTTNGPNGSATTIGTISTSGVFTPPADLSSPTAYTITAVSTADSTQSATATVYVFIPGTVTATANSQVAQYSIGTFPGSTVTVQFGPDTTYGLKTWSVPAAPSGPTSILVAGMKASTTYHLQGLVQLSQGTLFMDTDQTFTTGAPGGGTLPPITASTSTGATPTGGIELMQLITSPGVVATNLEGDVIWYDNNPMSGLTPNPAKLLPNGHMLINWSNDAVTDGSSSLLQEIDLAGRVVWQIDRPTLNQTLAAGGFNISVIGTHHDVALLPNGHMIVIASLNQNVVLAGDTGPTTVVGDVLIDLDENHKPVWTWSTFDHLDVNRHLLGFPPDWTHTNAILYSASDGDLVISMRHQSWLVKIDYADGKGTGNIVWKLGWQGDFKLEGGTDPYDWFYAQHGPNYVNPNTTSGQYELLLFDNGNNAPNPDGSTCGATGAAPCQSRAQLFQIDEVAKTTTISWQYELSSFSFWGGYAQTLANSNVEFEDTVATSSPQSSTIYEMTPSATPQKVWQMQIGNTWAYRGQRIPSLYPGVQW